ncbi:hypothetical protein ACFVYP_12975 [Kitasatospora sp. NPDC058201]|uniref:hypothetical protein n=1 Tax=unclassified Kitasatospora TaxID=2633591 RepID=UPI0036695BED
MLQVEPARDRRPTRLPLCGVEDRSYRTPIFRTPIFRTSLYQQAGYAPACW